jgi:hypothetical protein
MKSIAEMPSDKLNLIAEYPAMARIHFDPTLSAHQKKLRMLPFLHDLRKKQTQAEKDHRKANQRIEHLEGLLKAAEEGQAWLKLSPIIEKNDCSRIHHLSAAMKADKVVVHDGKPLSEVPEANGFWTGDLKRFQPFVVQHDWAKAFEGATDYADGQIKLPYDDCIFEFRISGKTVAIFASQNLAEVIKVWPFVQFGEHWIISAEMASLDEAANGSDFFSLAAKEIRAICIALDAEVAVHSVVRAPHALNVKRKNEGKIPIFDHHIVKLSDRHRASAKRFGDTHKSPRLHFRRGHWRHFQTHKTWIKWMLVGDPELGFVDKEYRL